MTDEQRHIAQAILDAIAKSPGVSLDAATGPVLVPGIRTGDLYVAFHKRGVHLSVFNQFMQQLLSTGKVVQRGDFYQLPAVKHPERKAHGH